MTPDAVRGARATLGEMWGKGRPLKASELGRALGLAGDEPGQTVLRWERGKVQITGPASLLIQAFLDGWRPK